MLEYKKRLCAKKIFASKREFDDFVAQRIFFTFAGWYDLKNKKTLKNSTTHIRGQVKGTDKIRIRKKLLTSAKKREKNERLYYLMQTIASTGLRVSEIKYVTVEAVKKTARRL
ncbi:MAG: hypothetical protein L6V93_21310 [Clostridiales bacterium]|nr:MAG: hypothetical protein L6V93_21310 [Clostridiales bacterium]